MSAGLLGRLESLARADPTAAPLALLQAEALRSLDAGLLLELRNLGGRGSPHDTPLLHGATLGVDEPRAAALVVRLAERAARMGQPRAGALATTASRGTLEVLVGLEASVLQDDARVGALAASIDIAGPLLATLLHLGAWPLLQACGERAAPTVGDSSWGQGFCPVCAAWPVLAELRGLEQQPWLRCGRCGAGWRHDHQRCPYCGARHDRALRYLAGEATRESRRAIVCDRCGGYLKAVAALQPSPPAELAYLDLSSLELDAAAAERGYARPAGHAFLLDVRLQPAGSAA